MAHPIRFATQCDIEQMLIEAQHRWLRTHEICEILRNYKSFNIAPEPPNMPPSGSLFLFDRKVLRYFRKDGYSWRKKKDGKTVKEAHERLKAGSIDVLHCYYAHGEDNENFQRRSYWMLEEELSHIVLVHYREVKGYRTNFNRFKETEETIVRAPEIEQLVCNSKAENSMNLGLQQNSCEILSQNTDSRSLNSAQASDYEDTDSGSLAKSITVPSLEIGEDKSSQNHEKELDLWGWEDALESHNARLQSASVKPSKFNAQSDSVQIISKQENVLGKRLLMDSFRGSQAFKDLVLGQEEWQLQQHCEERENPRERKPPAAITMCGILAVFGCLDNSQAKRSRIIELSRRLRHRGPDWSGLHCFEDCYLAHQRLAIVDPTSGDQPLYNEDKTIVVTVNGEIYNHKQLREKLKSHQFRTGSDCEVIAHLYEEHGEEFVDMLDGMFSFVLLDTRDKSFIAARDAIGITPLYMGWGLDGSVWFASEMKALSDDCERFIAFPPGHIYSSKQGGLRRWFNSPWYSEQIPSTPYDPMVLREAFERSVIKRLMTDVPFGVLLSGGLDSSLVAAVASRHLAETEGASQWGSQLHSFCVGLKGSPDLIAAREVADYLGTRHHEFHFTVQEGLDALEEVIYHIETYDVTTIRASTPMFLMSRKIKSLGVKMVISGEGSDEIFGGYLYFHKAPNKEEFHEETCRKIKALHLYDCLRANKSTSAWGVEARVPFLDKDFINIAMSIDPEWKMIKRDQGRIEKWILRNAFDDEKNPYLPKHILYRQKEQFSDGVGYSWIDGLKDHASKHVTDSMLANASFVYPENTPTTKEGYYYRAIFEKFFPKIAARQTVPGGPSVACSTAKAVEWDASWSKNLDPSGRAALGVHEAAYEETEAAKNVNSVGDSCQALGGQDGVVSKIATVV